MAEEGKRGKEGTLNPPPHPFREEKGRAIARPFSCEMSDALTDSSAARLASQHWCTVSADDRFQGAAQKR